MYRKDSEGWLKHFDFLVLDLLCLQVAFVLAYGISGYGFFPYNLLIYRNMAIFIEFADIAVLFACGTLKNVLKRGHYREFLAAFQNTIMLGAVAILYLFLLRQGQKYSRLALILNMILYFFLTYIVREIRKYALYKKMKDSDNRSLLIITTKEAAEKVTSHCGFGGGCVNDTIIHLATSEMGFGGFGESGMGSYHGKDGFHTFSHYKSIVDKKTWLDLPMRYQPYRKIYEKLLRKFLK